MLKSRLLPLLPDIKNFGYKIEIQCNSTPLVAEQNNYINKTVNAYIVNDLDDWNFSNITLKNCLLGATNVRKYNDESKYAHSNYGIAFDGKGE